MTVKTMAGEVGDLVKAAQREPILVSERGRPIAIVVGAENYDEEDWSYMTDPSFWQMIEKRRQERDLIPLELVKAETDEEIRRIGSRRIRKTSSANTIKRNTKGKPNASA
ncbi:MAG: type II toxin-antitoxin system prevent-host-death family antitoxin [Tepidisphaeraceae bacterium]|jgi:prevent-host-death family protein